MTAVIIFLLVAVLISQGVIIFQNLGIERTIQESEAHYTEVAHELHSQVLEHQAKIMLALGDIAKKPLYEGKPSGLPGEVIDPDENPMSEFGEDRDDWHD